MIDATREGRARGREGGYDIVKIDWLIQCLQVGYLVPLSEEHIYVVRPTTKLNVNQSTDCFGDSYTVPVTAEQLRDDIFPRIAVGESNQLVRVIC